MLTLLKSEEQVQLYQWNEAGKHVQTLIASTPQTRHISNDPLILGTTYTDLLQEACTNILKYGDFHLTEDSTVVINILRGGLNFALRNALAHAYGWQSHTTCFISAQRARNSSDSEEWHITENAYRKVYFPQKARLVIGDVVATGTSLKYALAELLNSAVAQKIEIRSILFFTYGGPKALEILQNVDTECRKLFPKYEGTTLIFLEGCFEVPDLQSRLSIRLTGTDLLRGGSVMAPEFIESQYSDPAFPLERCVIYDAGSRAFWIREYAADVLNYWKQVLELASKGMTYTEYLEQRFPELDSSRIKQISLREIALRQIDRISKFTF